MSPSLIERYRDWWTRTYARLRYGGVIDESTLSSRSGSQPVYYVSSSSVYIGQKTPGAGTIIINKDRFGDLPELSAERIIEHEIGHQKRHPILQAFLWVSIMFAATTLVLFLMLFGMIVTTEVTLMSNLELIGILLVMVFMCPIAIYLDELAAELHVLNHLSVDEYLKAYEMMPEGDDVSALTNAITEFIYPNPRTVIRIHDIAFSFVAKEVR